jgi:hypothetical protein
MLVNAYATHVDPPALDFPHTLLNRRDRTDPGLHSHLSGMLGQLLQRGSQGPAAIHQIRTHLDHVQTQLAFEVDDSADLAPVRDWAERSNALFFLPDASLRDPDFRVLFHPEPHQEDTHATVPHFTHGQQRKLGTIATLNAWGVHTNDNLPPLPADPEVRLPATGDIINRMATLLAVAVRSETVQAGNPFTWDQIAVTLPRAVVAPTPAEHHHLTTPEPTPQKTTNMLWRYECVPVLAWTLGIVPDLAPPTQTCDVPAITSLILGTNLNALERRARLRSVADILDQADLMYRLHWALRDAQLNGQPAPDGIDASVILERRWTLEWLLDPTTPWDEITLNT